MSKHKVTRYDDGGDVDAMEEANKGENLDTEAGPKAMPRRPISRTPAASAAPSRMSGPGRKPTGPSSRGTTDTEPRDRFGIPTSMGSAGKSYAPTGKAAESASGSELMRNLEAAGNATGASAAIQGVRRGAAVGKGLSEFAAGRKAAPAVAKAAEKAAPAVSTKRAAPKADTLDKFNEGLRNAPRPVSKPTATQKEWAKGPRMGKLGKGAADTLDEFGGAMKRGGSVKGYAKGGSASSRADGIAQRGKTRGTMFCGGGMTKGRK